MALSRSLGAVKQFLYTRIRMNNFAPACNHVNVTTVEEGSVKMELDVTEEMAGMDGKTMSAGCLFTAFDKYSGATMCTVDTRLPASVSAQMHYFYLAEVGDTLLVDARVVNNHGRHVYIDVEFYSKKTGKLVAKGGQTMAYPGGKGQQVKNE